MEANRELVAKNIDKLDIPARDKEMIRYRYGLTTEPHTLEATGRAYGLSKQRVEQIEKAVLAKIREGGKLRTIE